MHRTTLDFSGIILCIESPFELNATDKPKLFTTDDLTPTVRVKVTFSDSISDAKGDTWTENGITWHCLKNMPMQGKLLPYAHVGYSQGNVELIMHENYRSVTDVSMVLRTMDLNHILLQSDAFVLHASYVIYKGKALIFTAPSGVGKSTQAMLWEKYRGAEIINGDRCLIRKTENGFVAGGMYYSGTSEYCINRTAAIDALVLLRQSKQSTAKGGQGIGAFRHIFKECTHKTCFPEDTAKAAQLVADLTESICIAELACLPDETAVTALEEFLNGRTVC